MKVLVATKKTQGFRKNDFSWTDEGECLGFSSECDGATADDSCGCARSFSGLATHKATTTAVVEDKKGITENTFIGIYRLSMVRAGWVAPGEDAPWVREQARSILEIASRYAVGTIVEKRGESIGVRFPEMLVSP
jgi:hypothetical protein